MDHWLIDCLSSGDAVLVAAIIYNDCDANCPAHVTLWGPAIRREGRGSALRLAASDAANLALLRQLHGSQELWNQWKQIRKPI